MNEIVYWIPVRTIGATEKDKICKCSKCGSEINNYDLEQLKFAHRTERQMYENAIKEEYYTCSKCGSNMNMHVTYGIIEHGLAFGDENLGQIVEELIGKMEIQPEQQAIEILKRGGCVDCNGTDDSAISCENKNCEVRMAVEMAITALEEIHKYKKIGTLEECRASMEKQKEKMPIRNDLCTCPSCGTYNDVIKKRRNTVAFDTVYCWHCGQAMKIERTKNLITNDNEKIIREQLEKPVTQVIKEVREKMCDGYCRFPMIYNPDIWEEVAEEVCKGCPLDRL